MFPGNNISAGEEFGSLYERVHVVNCTMETIKRSNEDVAAKMRLPLSVTRKQGTDSLWPA